MAGAVVADGLLPAAIALQTPGVTADDKFVAGSGKELALL